MTKVEFQGVSKVYEKGAPALSGIDLAIRSGEFLVLLGPSGCGKSTLLRCLAGLETPSAGEIRIEGKRVNELSPLERGIGMVFQDYALYPHMKVRGNLAFGLEIQRVPRAEINRRIDEVAAMLGLVELLERKPTELSGGQRQRVAIGRALIQRPRVLLLDEPLSNLDAQLRGRTRIEIASLHRRIGATTLYVTHDQEEAMTLADRIVVLKEGKIQQVASPLELYHQPINRFVAAFVGTPSMNFLEGILRGSGGRWEFETEGQKWDVSGGVLPGSPARYVLGFRPEDAVLTLSGSAASSVLGSELVWVESHGHEVQVIVRLGECSLTLRTSDAGEISWLRGLAPGARLSLGVNLSRIHWFEPTGEGLWVQAQPSGENSTSWAVGE